MNAKSDAAPQSEQLLDKLGQSMQERRGVDASDREEMLRTVEAALSTSATLESPEAGGSVRDTWLQTLDSMCQQGLLGDGQREALVRQFDQYMPSQDDETLQWAAEFTRRRHQDGEEKAREWLQSQVAASKSKDATPAEAPPAGMTAGAALSMRRRR